MIRYTNVGIELLHRSVDEYPDGLYRVLALFAIIVYFVLACKEDRSPVHAVCQ